jgi:nucleotide-binding universal stress UspA family protein
MFKHILVPLDGSKLAEAALPAAASLARTLRAPATLLHIIEQDAPQEVHNDRHLTKPGEAKAYLVETAKRAFAPGSKVDTHVHTAAVADVVRSIVSHAQEEMQPDLIVLCSHGRSGMRDLVSSSIAQQVVAESTIPVLLIKPQESGPAPFDVRKILVPLDNESVHDASLPYAEELARAYSAELDLVCVIPTPGTLSGEKAAAGSMLPATARLYLDMREENARQHFQEHLEDFKRKKIQATAKIARGDPAAVITKTADEVEADVIVFGTHGKAGLEAFWTGSVAANVARRTAIPLLLIPLPE